MKRWEKQIINTVERKISSEKLGSICFRLGLLVTIVMAVATTLGNVSPVWQAIASIALIAIGLVIGFLNVTKKEATEFLAAAIVLALLSGQFLGSLFGASGINGQVATFLTQIFSHLILLVVPAALWVALRTFIIDASNDK